MCAFEHCIKEATVRPILHTRSALLVYQAQTKEKNSVMPERTHYALFAEAPILSFCAIISVNFHTMTFRNLNGKQWCVLGDVCAIFFFLSLLFHISIESFTKSEIYVNYLQLKYEAFALISLHSHPKIFAVPFRLCVKISKREANGVIVFHYKYVLFSFKLITLSIISLQCVAMVVVVAIPSSVY